MPNSAGVTVARINVKVSPDTKEFRKLLKAELEDIEKTLKGDVHIKAHLDAGQAKADFQRMKSQMERDGRVKIHVDTVRGGDSGVDGDGVGAASRAARAARSAGNATSGLKLPFPSFGTGINPTGWAVVLAGITTAAGPLVGLISSALVALPGLAAAAVLPIAAVALGLGGITKAATEAGLFEDKKPGKKGGGSLGAALQDLKTTVSDVFAKNLVEPFKQIGAVANQIVAPMGAIAKGATDIFAGITNGITNSMPRIQSTINNVAQAMSAAQPGWQSFTSGLTGLADQFTAKLPAVSEWFNNAMSGFDQWVTRVSADGSLSNAFDGLGQTLKSIMSTIADLGKQGIEFMGDPANIQMTKDILEGVHKVLSDIMTVSTAIAGKWDSIKSALTGASVFGKLATGDFMGAWDTFKGSDLGQRNDYIGTKGEVDAVTGSLKNASSAAAEAKQNIAAVTQGGVANAQRERRGFDPIAPPVSGINGKVGGGADASMTGQAEVRQKVPPPDTSEAKAALQEYKSTTVATMNETKTAIEQATSKVNVQPPDLSQFQAAFDGVKTAAQGAVDGIASSFDGLGERVGGSAQAAADAVRNPFVELAGSMQQVGWDISAGLAAGITSGGSLAITAAVNVATEALAAAKHALDSKSPSKKFMELGQDVSHGLAIGIDKGSNLATDQAKDLAGKVAEAFAANGETGDIIKGLDSKEIKHMEKLLSIDMKRLEIQAKALEYQAKMQNNPALKAQAQGLRDKKEELSMQKDILGLTNDTANSDGGGEDPLVKAASRLMKSPGDFAQATGKQFMSDIGIKGDGMIGNAVSEGIKYIFNIGSVDEAFSAMNRQNSVTAQSMVGR